jgi:hypothetical protein
VSGIDLLLRTAIDYERTHQLALFTLLSKSALPGYLVGVTTAQSILWEPEGQLFDLGVVDGAKTRYLELKMWSALSDSQRKRQQDFLTNNKCPGYYVLLGTSWFEHSATSITRNSGGVAAKIGYGELIAALNQLMITTGQSPEVYELALAYRNAIQEQFDKLKNAFTAADSSRICFYSQYWEIQKRLKNLETAIYTVNNQGGPVYILNSSDYWLPFSVGQISVDLYYEVVNGRLCIKFYAEASDADKYMIRDHVRQDIKSVLGQKYQIVDSGRLGAYMTACQIDHDFRDISKLDDSAAVFQDVANEFTNIIQAI